MYDPYSKLVVQVVVTLPNTTLITSDVAKFAFNYDDQYTFTMN